MICCSFCFKDPEIRDVIKSLKKIGDCETCGKINAFIYDTAESNKDLIQLFEGLLEIYRSTSLLPEDYPKEERDFLRNDLHERWNIFNLEKEKIGPLIKNICTQKYLEDPDLFDEPVGILSLHKEDYIKNSILKNNTWEDFVKGIKYHNRFHTDYFNLDIFELFLKFSQKSYSKNEIFYRARISNSDGLEVKEMGAPPMHLASDGRVNASGISCLYVSDDRETTIREIRAGAHDFVTIGKFKLLEDITIVDLMNLHQISPFKTIDIIDFSQHAVNRRHLEKIGREIAKPLRRQDSALDYLPTQYISDFIKSRGFQGIEYTSTLHEGGRNMAVFNQELLKCTEVSVVKIKEVNYSHVPQAR